MLKLTGAVLIVIATVNIARVICRYYTDQIRLWRDFYQCLLLIKSEILYLKTPLPQILAMLQKKGPDTFFTLFSNMEEMLRTKNHTAFDEIWKQTIRDAGQFRHFPEKDLSLILETGEYLGHPDTEVQSKRLNFCMEETKEKIQNMERRLADKQKTIRCLCAVSGILCILLLL
jgi:stage III sporulation protein AB